eukprot:gnl/TRDRNA2_/TRDRNA2_151253_c1_seq1.p1 gnl/TRDRNA2_/TRDRNA2_151253_c1~~gnl/TRDRNA2_/TRDRNA2_151253_c1_seq1.p1  ORF type:complete len:465 (-),score=96.64 gnl/TRDRNA2_/TRDRNA2_151253_c1_seq1:145-1500(-)
MERFTDGSQVEVTFDRGLMVMDCRGSCEGVGEHDEYTKTDREDEDEEKALVYSLGDGGCKLNLIRFNKPIPVTEVAVGGDEIRIHTDKASYVLNTDDFRDYQMDEGRLQIDATSNSKWYELNPSRVASRMRMGQLRMELWGKGCSRIYEKIAEQLTKYKQVPTRRQQETEEPAAGPDASGEAAESGSDDASGEAAESGSDQEEDEVPSKIQTAVDETAAKIQERVKQVQQKLQEGDEESGGAAESGSAEPSPDLAMGGAAESGSAEPSPDLATGGAAESGSAEPSQEDKLQSMIDRGYKASALRQAGFDALSLRKAGFSAESLVRAGFNRQSLKQASATAWGVTCGGENFGDCQSWQTCECKKPAGEDGMGCAEYGCEAGYGVTFGVKPPPAPPLPGPKDEPQGDWMRTVKDASDAVVSQGPKTDQDDGQQQQQLNTDETAADVVLDHVPV